MALQTPRHRGLQRPSYGNLNSSGEKASLSSSTAVSRKASLLALTGGVDPNTPGRMDVDLEVGDLVSVPGDMYGTVKFVGSVKGKSGRFVGVELSREFAARGKNDGDVDGTSYFTTAIPGSGIFLPVHRAEKRSSPNASNGSHPGTPNTPSRSTAHDQRNNVHTSPTIPLPHKFSQSSGPGARPASPQFKAKRPSLPRPESPLRKQPNLAPTPARTLSQSQRGARPVLSSTTPSKPNLRASTNTRPPTSHTPRPYSRTGSRTGHRPDSLTEEDRTPLGNGRSSYTSTIPSFSQPLRSPSRTGSAGGLADEIQRLRVEVAEKDKRLHEQAVSLQEMEANVKELSTLLPTDGLTPGGDRGEDVTAVQLRQMLREKNEKIGLLTAEFDAHRADFRSTLDSLEMASTETERVYEGQKRELIAQVEQLQEANQSKEDFEGVALQLKQLEELVAELEEGLEESRRGEAEARGEVEFLRGEVERGRSELRREREKAASVVKGGDSGSASSKELKQKDDEIRGLKAIVHSLSSGPQASTDAASKSLADPAELQRLQAALSDSNREKEDLEKELEQLRRDNATTNGHGHTRNESEQTATAADSAVPIRQRSDTIKATFAEHVRRSGLESAASLETNDHAARGVFCDMCQSREHDTLDCNTFSTAAEPDSPTEMSPHPSLATGALAPAALSPGKENRAKDDDAKAKVTDEEKWCALCEKDGHLAFDCPEEQY
nr:dynactin subunit 1 [Quercus suber]